MRPALRVLPAPQILCIKRSIYSAPNVLSSAPTLPSRSFGPAMPIYSPCTRRRRRILASLNTARSSTVPRPKFITYSLTADQKKIFATARLPASRPCRRKLLGDDGSWFARKFAGRFPHRRPWRRRRRNKVCGCGQRRSPGRTLGRVQGLHRG